MIKRFSSIVLFFSLWITIPIHLGAREVFDFGGQIRGLVGWEAPGDGALLEGEPSLWVRADFTPTVSLELSARILSTLERAFLLDLQEGVFKIVTPRFPELDSSFTFQVGRFQASDFTGFVFDHRLDGAYLYWEFPFTSIHLNVGYLGWQPIEVSEVQLSRSDALDLADNAVTFGPPRMVEIATFRFPELLATQDITFSFIAQQDLRVDAPGRPAARDDRIHTLYMGLGSSGPLWQDISLTLFGYLSLGFAGVDSRVFSGIYGVGLDWKLEDRYKTEVGAYFVSSSGDERLNNFFDSPSLREAGLFLPVSARETGVAFSPILGNITYLQVRYGMYPLPRVWSEASLLLFFRTTAGPISEPGLDTLDRSDLFLGPEANLQVQWRLYSDLMLRSRFGVFFPFTGAVGAFAEGDPRVKGTLEVLLTF